MIVRTGLGQDSHAFGEPGSSPLVLGGVRFNEALSLEGESDRDVVLHSLVNALHSISKAGDLGDISRPLLKRGVTDSISFATEAVRRLPPSVHITSVAISLVAEKPRMKKHIPAMEARIAETLGLAIDDVAITAISGEGLSFGPHGGIMATAIVTAIEE